MKFFKDFNREDFKEMIALFSLIGTFAYMYLVTFIKFPKENQRFADIILGSLLTLVLGKVLGEYFNSKNKDKDGKEQSNI